MATLAVIYEFEKQLEAGFSVLLTGATTNIYYRRSTEEMESPCVEVLVTTGPALTHERNQTVNTDEDMFSGTLDLRVVTRRSAGAQDHHALLSAVRVALRPAGNKYNSTNFPNLAVMEIIAQGTAYEVDDERGLDITSMAFGFFFCIRPTVWP